MKPNPQPLRFAAYIRDEAHLQDELLAKLNRAIETDSVTEVARKMKVSRRMIQYLRGGRLGFGLGTAFLLARAYPDA